MRQPALIAAFAAAAFCATAAQASAPVYRLGAPQVAADGLSVHGAVCRAGASRFAASPVVTVDQVGPDGRIVSAKVALYGDLGPGGPGCFHYQARLIAPAAQVRVCAVRRLDADAGRQCVNAG